MEEKKDIYNILVNMKKLTEMRYNRLVDIYGNELVDSMIEFLIKENDDNFYKFEWYYSKFHNSMDISSMDMYDLYLIDVDNTECFNSVKNDEIMKKICVIRDELCLILDEIGYNELIKGKNKAPWLADKVDYCIKKCDDKDKLDRIKLLYKEYCYYKDMVVVGNLRLVLNIAYDYSHRLTNVSIDDIVQQGNLGLIRAIEKFDINKGVTFTTYAGYWIRQKMIKDVKQMKYPMKFPMELVYDIHKILNCMNDLSICFGRTVTAMDVSKHIGMPLEKVERLLVLCWEPLALDEVVEYQYEDDDNVFDYMSYFTDDSVNVLNDAISELYRGGLEEFLKSILTEREYLLLKLKSGLNNDDYYSYKEIASIFGVSLQRVFQIKNSASKKLKRIPNIMDIIMV